MKKLTFLILIALSVAGTNSFATGKKDMPKAKKAVKCSMGGTCCKKTISRAAMLRQKR